MLKRKEIKAEIMQRVHEIEHCVFLAKEGENQFERIESSVEQIRMLANQLGG